MHENSINLRDKDTKIRISFSGETLNQVLTSTWDCGNFANL